MLQRTAHESVPWRPTQTPPHCRVPVQCITPYLTNRTRHLCMLDHIMCVFAGLCDSAQGQSRLVEYIRAVGSRSVVGEAILAFPTFNSNR